MEIVQYPESSTLRRRESWTGLPKSTGGDTGSSSPTLRRYAGDSKKTAPFSRFSRKTAM